MKKYLKDFLENEHYEFLEMKILEVEEFCEEMKKQTFPIKEFQSIYDFSVMQPLMDFKEDLLKSIEEHIEEKKRLLHD